MLDLERYIEKYNIIEDIENCVANKIILSLECWINTFKIIPLSYDVPKIFESVGQFNNCGKVIKMIINYMRDHIEEESYTHNFECSQLDVFFDNLIINVKNSQYNYGQFVEYKDKTVTIDLFIKNEKLISNDIEYCLIHELIHSYEDYIRNSKGLPSINNLFKDSKYRYEYQQALKYMHLDKIYKDGYEESDEEYSTRIIAKCRYFLDEHELKAYLGTLKDCIHNISEKIGPTFRDLKFDKVIELFRKEYIWQEYLDIYVFMNNIEDIDDIILQNVYYNFYHKKIEKEKIIKELRNKWNKFEKLFLKYFAKGYSEDLENIKLESFYQPPVELIQNPYTIYG